MRKSRLPKQPAFLRNREQIHRENFTFFKERSMLETIKYAGCYIEIFTFVDVF